MKLEDKNYVTNIYLCNLYVVTGFEAPLKLVLSWLSFLLTIFGFAYMLPPSEQVGSLISWAWYRQGGLIWHFRIRPTFTAALHGIILQGNYLDFRLDSFYLESNHEKFQLNPLRNGWDIGFLVFKDSAVLHGRLQCCRVTVLTKDLILSL